MDIDCETWLQYCREYAQWKYEYSDMVDDTYERFLQMYAEGARVDDAVEYIGDKYDLDEMDSYSRGYRPPLEHTSAARFIYDPELIEVSASTTNSSEEEDLIVDSEDD